MVGNMDSHTMVLKQWSAELGFDHCGIARAVRLNEDAERLENWLVRGMHGSMKYMENHFDMRLDPRKLVTGAKSVVSLLLNYFPNEKQNADWCRNGA